jgi:hypothetical protein
MPASPKPSKRIIDSKAVAAARLDWCENCGQRVYPPGAPVNELFWSHVHHIKSRGAGGSDIPENLY